jgi:hypothetical protein
MGDNYNWQIDEDEEQAGKHLILSRENVNGFNPQREGHGSNLVVLLALLIPLVLLIILGLLTTRLSQTFCPPLTLGAHWHRGS